MFLTKGKKKCDCGMEARWIYMPGYGDGYNSYICDECVTSVDDFGCSCNWHHETYQEGAIIDKPEGIEGKDWRWIEMQASEYSDAVKKEDGYWQYLDEKGRPYPCCEYEYDKDGFYSYTWLGRKLSDLDMWFYFFRGRVKHRIKSFYKSHIASEVPKELEELF